MKQFFVILILACTFLTSCRKKSQKTAVKSVQGVVTCNLPPDQSSGLPLPTTLKNEEFQKQLYEFLENQKYQNFNWIKDQKIRDTGPMVGKEYLGTHPAVLVYYSKGVSNWVSKERKECIPDGSIIVNEMFAPPASNYTNSQKKPKATSWTVMIRDQKGSRDGWYWAHYDATKKPSGVRQGVDSHDFPFRYADSGFGSYCVRCHSAAASSLTFSTKNHFEGPEFSTLPYHEYLNLVKSSKTLGLLDEKNSPKINPHGDNSGLDAASGQGSLSKQLGPIKLTPDVLNPSFMASFKEFAHLSSEQSQSSLLSLPNVTHDTVPAAQVAQEFVSSDQCMGCHDADRSQFGITPSTPLGNLVIEEPNGDTKVTVGQKSVSLKNVSPYGEWRWSMMGLAGRDPIFFAQLESETTLFSKSSGLEINPETKKPQKLDAANIQNICFSCHGAMGQRQLAFDREKAKDGLNHLFSADMPLLKSDSGDAHAKYGALARDGISCMVCHQMEDNSSKKIVDIATGNFTIKRPENNMNTIFGPREDVAEHYMSESLGMKPTKSEFISKSRFCATCHVVFLPALDSEGNVKKWGYEQTTYLEWENSKFGVDGPSGTRCQGCHMPKEYLGRKTVGKLANVQDNDFPDSIVGKQHPEHLKGVFAPSDKLDVKVRNEGVSRHGLEGVNLFGLEMFLQFDDILGVRRSSYMSGIDDGLESSIRSGANTAANFASKVTILDGVRSGNQLTLKVQVTNFAGHRMPSGVGFRRAFLEVTAKNADDKTVWSSGATNSTGEILDGATGQPLASERSTQKDGKPLYQPHYQSINRQDQAQIYEELVTGENGELTTSFLSIFGHLKDSRLLPDGWKKEGLESHDEEQKKALLPHLPMFQGQTDPDFGAGGDTVEYVITLPEGVGPVNVSAKLFYQAIPPRYLRDRFRTASGVSTKRLFYMTSRLNVNKPHLKDWKTPLAQTLAKF